MASLEQLQAAHQRIQQLQTAGTPMTSREARRAVNHLMTLIRGATPEELVAFEGWKRQQPGGPARAAGGPGER
ncbi:MAG: hypothetical protein HYY02_03660 [Chloroflexi bacterium]|nr:hypothetical protein [Chloroflexota bacterium]